jgi:16S rRNA (uracil1498-N3)-methyltransferase
VRRRFFVDQLFVGRSAFIEGDTAHHLGRVLRAQPGQLYELSDGIAVWLGRIESVSRDRIEFVLLEEIPSPQPAVNIILLLSIVKFDAFEWALEKATELGVAVIAPVAAARSEKSLLAAANKRADRWQKILVEASQQSRRVRVPVLSAPLQPGRAFREAYGLGAKILLSERSVAPPLRVTLSSTSVSEATLAIGPEGGWTVEEFALAAAAGFREASLGKLILRTETTVIAALASLNYALGV